MRTNNDKGKCRACGEVVFWARTEKKKLMPVNLAQDEKGNLELWRDPNGQLRVTVTPKGTSISHFATCEKRKSFATARSRVDGGPGLADIIPIQ